MKRIAPLAIAACIFALSMTLAAPTEANGRNGRHDRHRVEQRHRDHDRHRHGRHHVDRHRDRYRDHRRFERPQHRRYQRFDVPRDIQRDHYREYRPYLDRQVWFAPHRHRHSSYHFPVVIDGYRTSRRYDYCEGELFRPYGSVGYEGRNFGIRLNF